MAIAVGRYEWTVTRFLRSHLGDARVFFDVGANTGYFTRLALSTMPQGVVVAFEPDAAWHAALMSLDRSRVVLRPEAIGQSDGTGTLVSAPGSCSRLDGALAIAGPATRTPTTVRSIDGMLEKHEIPAPDVLKIDVEGSELDVIIGAACTLDGVQAMAVECHSMPLFRDVLDRTIVAGFDRIQCTSGGDDLGPPTILASRTRALRSST
jgi:FkbM family methyltransferase